MFLAYEDLIQQGYPLPCVSTLQKRTKDFNFYPGVFEDVIQMMGEKISKGSYFEKFFALSLDEVSLKSGSEMVYDMKSDAYLGEATLPDHSGPASKALVFQIASIGKNKKIKG